MAINSQISKVDISKVSYAAKTTVVGQEETPALSVSEMQESVEYMPRNLLAPKVNELVAAVNGSYSKQEADAAINEKVSEIGAGDMAAAVYDKNGAVKKAGGIDGYVAAQTSALNTFMNAEQGVSVLVDEGKWGKNAQDGSWRQTVADTGVDGEMIPVSMAAWVKDSDLDGGLTDIAELSRQLGLIKLVRTRNNGSVTFICPDEKPSYTMLVRIAFTSLRSE